MRMIVMKKVGWDSEEEAARSCCSNLSAIFLVSRA